MISSKDYENSILGTAESLGQIYEDSIKNGSDLKVVSDHVKQQCYQLLELTLKFQGQEEAFVERYKKDKKLPYSDSIFNWGIK